MQSGKVGLLVDPSDDIDQPFGKKRNVEHVGTVELLIVREQVKKQRRNTLLIQCPGDGGVARAQAARAAAVGENNKCSGVGRYPQIAGQAQRIDDDLAPNFFRPLTAAGDHRGHGNTSNIFEQYARERRKAI
jgi:hypothetical protein